MQMLSFNVVFILTFTDIHSNNPGHQMKIKKRLSKWKKYSKRKKHLRTTKY